MVIIMFPKLFIIKIYKIKKTVHLAKNYRKNDKSAMCGHNHFVDDIKYSCNHETEKIHDKWIKIFHMVFILL